MSSEAPLESGEARTPGAPERGTGPLPETISLDRIRDRARGAQRAAFARLRGALRTSREGWLESAMHVFSARNAALRASVGSGLARSAYAERAEQGLSRADEMAVRAAGAVQRALARFERAMRAFPNQVGAVGAEIESFFDSEFAAEARRLGLLLRERGFDDAIVARCFALVREVAERCLGERPYDEQLMGGYALLHGRLAEMETGEGKTLTAVLPAAAAALAGIPVHIVTVNDYLAARDSETMGPIFRALGLTVGLIVSGLDLATRRAAYACDITYGTNKEIAFDYLKDRIALAGRPSQLSLLLESLADQPSRADRLLLRGLHFAIVDEADSVLVDEARTPLIIADRREAGDQEALCGAALELARELEKGRDFAVDERERQIRIHEEGSRRLAELANARSGSTSGRRRREELVRQALTALHLFHRDRQYLVSDGQVRIVDEFTGRVMPDRSWEHGLHQMIEVKEQVALTPRQETRARISYQRFFRRYRRLAGMTGTAAEVAGELHEVYRLAVVRIPTHRPLQRRDLGQRVLETADAKWNAIAARIQALHAEGRPVLVGTRSVAASETLSERLRAAGLPHRVLSARQDREEADVIARAGQAGAITVATNMAGRGTDIRLGRGAADAGGLHVIASERHEARRIDRQLFGRAARQGDPGSFESIVSLEDELFTTHVSRSERALLEAAAQQPALRDRALNLAFRRAQWRAERLHARARRELLQRDRDLDALLAFSGRPG